MPEQPSDLVLSICIPAYGFEEGVRRILNQFENDPRLEILISEDPSPRPLDLSDLRAHLAFTHSLNERANGAIENWNGVLKQAKGKYVWLLHHDEEPIFPNGVQAFLDRLQRADSPCVLVARLDIGGRWWQRALRKDTVRKIFARVPKSCLLHNPIGAPSNIIVRRDHLERFNTQLKWFVDMDWYFRLFSRCKHVTFSEFDLHTHAYAGSITAQVQHDLDTIMRREIDIVCNNRSVGPTFKAIWLGKTALFSQIKRLVRK